MERQYQLQVTSDTTSINVQSVNSDEVARIAQLAGLVEPYKGTEQNAVTPVPQDIAAPATNRPLDLTGTPDALDSQDMSALNNIRKNAGMSPMSVAPASDTAEPVDSLDTSDMDMDTDTTSSDVDTSSSDTEQPLDLDEDVAEYDYGHRKFKDEGEEIDEPDLIWQAVENPQRIKGSPGDNGLIQELHAFYTDQYRQYLEEVDRENEGGMMSPLSDPTKPSFDKDPLSDEEPVDDGSHSPLSTIVRQHAFK